MKTKKKAVRRKTRIEPWRAELSRIVRFLNESGTRESQKLWNVLTALRGPDFQDDATKYCTTAVIRHACGIRFGVGGCVAYPDQDNGPENRKHLVACSRHFTKHAQDAFDSLGLKWEEVNE